MDLFVVLSLFTFWLDTVMLCLHKGKVGWW